MSDVQNQIASLSRFARMAGGTLDKVLANCEKRVVKVDAATAKIEYFAFDKDGAEKILHTQSVKLSSVADQIAAIDKQIATKSEAKEDLEKIVAVIKGE